MVVAFSVLKGTQMLKGNPEVVPQAESIEDFLDEFSPSVDSIEDIFGRRLAYEAVATEDISLLTRDGIPISALLSKPEGFGPFPGIVLVHDAPSSATDTDALHGMLGQRLSDSLNAIVITVNWRDSIIGEEDLSDVLSAVDWFRRGSESKNQPILIAGVGQGAYLALLAAEQYSSALTGVIAINPVTDLSDLYDYQEENVPGGGDSLAYTAGCRSAADLHLCLTEDGATQGLSHLNKSLLIVHHLDHPNYPISQSLGVATALLNEDLYYIQVASPSDQTKALDSEEGAVVDENANKPTNEVIDSVEETSIVGDPKIDLTLIAKDVDIIADESDADFTDIFEAIVSWSEKVIASALAETIESNAAAAVDEQQSDSTVKNQAATIDQPSANTEVGTERNAPIHIEAK